ncbi:MAG: hypothetical protein COB61_003670 [Thiotrichales bacterium]|nr:hypothetical protein [Thiotrichales bacterium]
MPYQTWISRKEIFIYLIAIFTGLFICGYSIHMLIGGLVSATTERVIIGVVCSLMFIVIGLMVYDVKKQRQEQT